MDDTAPAHRAFPHVELVERTNELEQRTKQLEIANEQLESFCYSVSHDLRAPLRGISGFAQILVHRHRAALDPEAQHFLDNIVQASAHMGRLIDDLLSYSRLGRSAVTLKPVELAAVIDDVMTNLAPRRTDTGAQIEVAANLPLVLGDWTLLYRIFTNLLDNAITYHERGERPKIWVTCTERDGSAVVSVRDAGIGIDAQYFPKIFKVFQRLHRQEDFPGTGIGLAMVRKAVDLMDGDVWVESETGAGTTFTVRLALIEPGATGRTAALPDTDARHSGLSHA